MSGTLTAWLQNAFTALFGLFRRTNTVVSISVPIAWTGDNEPVASALVVTRSLYTNLSTIGDLSVDGKRFCYTLEDCCRKVKVPNKTAIPSGRYLVTLRHSPHFMRTMPHLEEVPGFSQIMIHWGNYDTNTDGCILVGDGKGDNCVEDSKTAFDRLFPIIEAKIAQAPLYISIVGGRA